MRSSDKVGTVMEKAPEGRCEMTAEKKIRHMQDIMIRESGFTIHARPAAGEPTWIRGGIVHPQSVVIRIIQTEKFKA